MKLLSLLLAVVPLSAAALGGRTTIHEMEKKVLMHGR